MEIAKVTSKGQITIPATVRKKMDLKNDSKVLFVEENGTYRIYNSQFFDAMTKIQKAFEGEAEKVGWKSEEDVVNYIKKLRQERKSKKQNENNA